MNWSLVRSRHGLVVGLILAATLAWWWSAGASVAESRSLRLGTGWLGLTTMAVVGAYGLRKYAHKGGYSPEFAMRTEYVAIERANRELRRLQLRVDRDPARVRREVQKEASAILRREGAHRVNRAVVAVDEAGHLTVGVAPREPLGRVRYWMRFHIWYGVLFGALVALHVGGLPRSGLGLGLAGLVLVVWGSGLVGLVAWGRGPRWMTAREKDLSIEEAFSLRETLARKRAAVLEQLEPARRKEVERALARGEVPAPRADDPEGGALLRDLAVLSGQARNVERDLASLRRVRWAVMGWKVVHVPAVLLLTAAVVVHVATVWIY